MSQVQGFYKDKTLFITGASGFIGSVLLDTVLAKLPDVRQVYCLYRGQPGAAHPRVTWIKGDVMVPGWGLEDRQLAVLRKEVQFIFHLAAYTRWDVGVAEQVAANTLPVLHGAALAQGFEQLESYVVTSSYWAACHLQHTHIAETVYQDYKGEEELAAIQSGSQARLAEWPNAYSYAKNLAERLLHQRHPDLPVLLARVTSACGAWGFPHLGFCRFDNAMPAFLRSVAHGVRLFPEAMKSAVNDSIPVDICVNALLVNAMEHAGDCFSVIHCASAHRNLLTTGAVAEMASEIEYLPSFDDVSKALATRKDRAAAINRLILDTYRVGIEKKYVFLDHEARRPLRWMSDADRAQFPIDVELIDWPALVGAMVDAMGPVRSPATGRKPAEVETVSVEQQATAFDRAGA